MSNITILGTLFDVEVDGTNLSDYNFYTYDIKKPLFPRQRVSTIDIPKRLGLIAAQKKFTDNELIVYGYVKGTGYDNLKTLLETLAGALYSDDDVELIPSNQTDRYWNVQYLDYQIIGERDDYTIVSLVFTANNPLGWAVTADTDNQTITTLDDTFNITNNGHYYAYPTYTVTFNQAQSHIYLQNNTIPDNRMDISKSFATNDELEIDSFDMTIRLNGSISPIGLGDGGDGDAEFVLLASGVNELAVGSDDATINIDIETSYRKTYLY
jgi:predicted phage tail component-like protein